MGRVTRELLPLAVAVAVSPVAVLAVIIMVLANRTRASSAGFVLGWVAGIALTCSICVLLSDAIGTRDGSAWSTAESLASLVLGLGFTLLAIGTWRRRPREGQVGDLPPWLATVDRLTVGRAAVLGLTLEVVNPKNLVVFPVAGSVIATAELSMPAQAAAVVMFTGLAASTVALPVVAATISGQRVSGPLDGIRGWLIRHTARVIFWLAAAIAAVLLARGLVGLLR